MNMYVSCTCLILLNPLLTTLLLFLTGAIHSNERPVHEEWAGIPPGLLHHSPVHIQWPPGSTGTDITCQGHWWCKGQTG